MNLASMKRIAVVRRNRIGDLLCTMPLLNYLKKTIPESHITLFIEKGNASLMPFLDGYDKCVVFPKGNKYISTMGCALKESFNSFDLAISAKTSPMKLMNFCLLALRAKERVAVVQSSWHSRCVNRPVQYFEEQFKKQHQALKALKLVNPFLKEVPEQFFPQIKIPQEVKNSYQDALIQRLSPLPNNTPRMLVSVTNNRVSGTLGVKGYLGILNTLLKRRKFATVISCQPADLPLAKELMKGLDGASVALETKELSEFILLLSMMDLAFIGHGGIMHMAAALNLPQVTLFAHTKLEEWRPLSRKATCFYHPGHVSSIDSALIIDALASRLAEVSK